MRSPLETNRIFGLRFLRPTQILVSNLNSVETKIMSGLRFGDRNPHPVSIRDQEDFGLQGGSPFEKGLGNSETEKVIGLKIKLETNCFGFKMQSIQRPICGFGLHLRLITCSVSNHKSICNFGLQI